LIKLAQRRRRARKGTPSEDIGSEEGKQRESGAGENKNVKTKECDTKKTMVENAAYVENKSDVMEVNQRKNACAAPWAIGLSPLLFHLPTLRQGSFK
jgi:hypothetical protein